MPTKLISIAVIMATLLGGLYWYGYKQEQSGSIKKELSYNKEVVEQVKRREQIRRQVRNFNDDALVREYCKCCVYGASYEECVRAYKPVD
jgi:cell division protein FtsB